MARKNKEPVHHAQMTEVKRQIIQQLLQEYDIETAEDIQDALNDVSVELLAPSDFNHSRAHRF